MKSASFKRKIEYLSSIKIAKKFAVLVVKGDNDG
jgi:hypothetical protein